MKEKTLREEFEEWIKKNYTGKIMKEIPKDVDLDENLFYRMNGLQYGPIPFNKIPKKFLI